MVITRSPASRLALSAVQGQLAKIVQSVLGLILGLFLARTLGPAGVGIYASALALAVLVQMASSLGLEDVMMSRVPGLLASERQGEAKDLVHAGAVVRAATASVMIAAGAIVMAMWGPGSGARNLSRGVIACAVIYAALNSMASLGAAVKASYSEALRPALLDSAWSCLMLSGVVTMAIADMLSPFRVIALAAATEAAVVVGYYILVAGAFRGRRAATCLIPKRAAATFWANNLLAFGFGKSTDLLLIRLAGLPFASVGAYSVAFSLFALPSVLLVMGMGTFLQVGLTSAIGASDSDRIERAWRRAIILMALVSIPAMAFVALESRLFIVVLYGNSFNAAQGPCVILAMFGIAIRAIGGGASQGVLYAKGCHRLSLQIRVSCVALNVLGNIVLIRVWGISGVAASTGAFGLLAIVLEYRCARRILRLPHPARNVWSITCGSAVACALTYAAPEWPGSDIQALAGHALIFLTTFYVFQWFCKPLSSDRGLVASVPAVVRVLVAPLSLVGHSDKDGRF
jgi:O-antigen/teichoic acid export membrane protein